MLNLQNRIPGQWGHPGPFRGKGTKSGSVPDVPGWLATMTRTQSFHVGGLKCRTHKYMLLLAALYTFSIAWTWISYKNPSIIVLTTQFNIIQTHLNSFDAWSFIDFEAFDDCISDCIDLILHFKGCVLESI